MSSDPNSTIQAIIDKRATGHIGFVVGVISPSYPYNKSDPYLLFAGDDLLSADQSQQLTLSGTTPFNLGSVAKIFTSTIQALPNNQQPNPFSGDFGDFFKAGTIPDGVANISLQDLAIYESGFPTDNHGIWWKGQPLESVSDLLKLLNNPNYKLPQFTSGSCYSYSNFGWGLLALASVGVSSPDDPVLTNWNQSIRNTLIGLQMPNTGAFIPSDPPNIPAGYDAQGNLLPADTDYTPTAAILCGAGNVTSTGADMYQWLAFHMGLTSSAWSVQETMQSQTYQAQGACCSGCPNPVVGRGWFLPAVADGDKEFLCKDGGVRGFSSFMAFQKWVGTNAPSPTGVFVLTNCNVARPLGRQFINLLLGNTGPAVVDIEEHSVPSQ